MSNTTGPLSVRAWCNHSVTTIGYTDEDGQFIAVADCSIGPDLAVNYESMAKTLASAPALLAERDRLLVANAELVKALARAEAALSESCRIR